MSAIRPLPRAPALVPGESFGSYVERLAAMHHVDLVVILQAVGLLAEERYEKMNGYGVLLSGAQLERFSLATRVPKEQVSSMLMSKFDGTVLNLSGVQAGDPQALRKRALDEWAYFSGSHVCPACVHENNGAWQLSWKLPWSFACTKHKCYMVAFCPTCKRRFKGGRRDHSLSPVFVRHVPTPGLCNNPKPFGESGIGKAATTCEQVISNIPIYAAGKITLDAQKRINEALAGVPQTVAGFAVSARDFFADLRSVCALILYCVEVSDLGRLPDVERAAFSKFAAQRDATVVNRKDSAEPRNGERVRVFIGPPEDPKLIAAVIRNALSILDAVNHEAMAELLKPIAERCIARAPKVRWNLMDSFRFSKRVNPALHLALAQKSTFDRAMGNRSLLAQDSRYSFAPCHVPQLIWATDFNAHFTTFFSEISDHFARRFCAMSLVKLCGDYTWGDTARLLSLPEHHSIKLANRCVGFLADEKTKRQFSKSLHAVAKRLSECPEKINYDQRRESFSGLHDIPYDDWLMICREAQITPGMHGRRSKYAATWLWSYLTDGDWMLAPALEGEHIINSREVYRTLWKGVLGKCRGALIEYGSTLLAKLEGCNVIMLKNCLSSQTV